MTDMEPAGMTPRDPEAERPHRVRRRRLRVVAVIAAGVVAALVIAQLAFGWVGRVVDASGLTCGGDWDRIEGDELASLQVIRWGTPEAREQGFDPDDFEDMPAGLEQPSLTTARSTYEADVYEPLLYPLGGGVVLQGGGYFDRTWVGADARTGDPLWGISEALEGGGYSTPHGRFVLVSKREDGRTDLTTFDPRTGEEISCVRLPGALQAVTEVGEHDVAVTVLPDPKDGEHRTSATLIRLDPETGGTVWSRDLDLVPADIDSDGAIITVSADSAEGLVNTGQSFGSSAAATLAVDAATGEELWRRARTATPEAVLATWALADGGSAVLVIAVTDSSIGETGLPVEYVLLDGAGSEIWRAPASAEDYVTAAWPARDAVVVTDGGALIALEMTTGERRWESGVFIGEDRAVMLDADGAATMLVTDRRVTSADGDLRLYSSEIDVATGVITDVDAPLRSARLADGYLISSTGQTQLVVPLAE